MQNNAMSNQSQGSMQSGMNNVSQSQGQMQSKAQIDQNIENFKKSQQQNSLQ